MPTSLPLFVLLFVALVMARALGHENHTCNHGHQSIAQKIRVQPPYAEVHSRSMGSQADTFRKIKVLLNTTFIDFPERDISLLTGGNKSCTSFNQTLVISTETSSTEPIAKNCIDDEGNVAYVGNCIVNCKHEDVVTPAISLKLKNAMVTLKQFFESWLLVQELPQFPTISTSGECGDLRLATQSLTQDTVIFLTLRTMPYLPTTLAFANPCSLHPSTHRPVTMHINVQPKTLYNNTDIETVLKHEIIHGLGFSSDMYKFYRHPNNRSQTYWQYDNITYKTGPVVSTPETVIEMNDFNDVHGPQIDVGGLGPGSRLKLVSPNVLAFGRQYFNCSTLDGVELENDGGNASAATHWESRLMFWELMTAVQKLVPGKLTGFTAALMKDTGFYDVDPAFVVDQMDFGYKKGCRFVNDRCNAKYQLSGGQEVYNWYFCDNAVSDFCGYNNQYIGRCNVMEFSGDLPVPYQYFESPRQAGRDEFVDRCPMTEAYTDGFCQSRDVYSNIDNLYLDTNGSSTRCYRSSVLDIRYTITEGTSFVKCFKTVCVDGTRSMVRMGDYYFPCKAMSAVEFVGSIARSAKPEDAVPELSFFIRNTKAKGIFTCTDPAPMCAEGLTQLNRDMLRSASWPKMTALDPPNITLEGGDVNGIYGEHLMLCTGVKIGDADVVEFVAANNSYGTFVGPVLDRTNGGKGADGSGEVQLQLRCKVTGCEDKSLGCFVDYAPINLYPRPPEEEDADEIDSLGEFFSTVEGRVVLGIMGLVVFVVLALLLKAMFCTTNDRFEDEEEVFTLSASPGANQKPLMAEEMHDL